MSKITIEGTPVSYSSASSGPDPGIPYDATSGYLLFIFESDDRLERLRFHWLRTQSKNKNDPRK